LAWAYEVKPEKARPTEPGAEEPAPAPETEFPTEVAPEEQRKSIVVLPFDNMSPDPGDSYFSDGLLEEIITYLSYLPSLRVISRNSAMVLKGTQKDTRTIARELGVQYVLEGSVRKSGDHLRIIAQLIDGASDEHLWADRYEGLLGDVFEIQDRVSRAIADSLSVKLSPEVERRFSDRADRNPAAYECFLRARADMWMLSGDSLDRALDWVERGLAIVSDDADLLAMKGVILFQRVNILGASPDTYASLLEKAQECADQAISLNPDSGAVQWVQAGIRHQAGDPAGAIKHFDLAVALEPSNADAAFMLGYQLAAVGCHLDHSREMITRAADLDPLTPIYQNGLGWLQFFNGEFEEATSSFRPWQMAMEEGKSQFRHFPAYLHAAAGNLDEAERLIDQMASDSPGQIMTSGMVFLKHAWLGERDAALDALTDEWQEAARWDDIYPLYMAGGLASIGDFDRALEWLDFTIDYGIRNPKFLGQCEPFLEPLRPTTRFGHLMEKAKRLSDSVPAPVESIQLFSPGDSVGRGD
jgi:TolB-like protein